MVLENLKGVLDRVAAAAKRAGRDPKEIELVAVTKFAKLDDMRELLKSGAVKYLGENRVQTALQHRSELGADAGGAQWRFIGHLQTNKVKAALEAFSAFDAVDSLKLAQALDGRLGELGRKAPCLVQVKLTDKDSQSGVAPEDVPDFLGEIRKLANLKPEGLMAIAPMLEPVEETRPHFRRMRKLLEECFPEGGGKLSMGMSRDFEIAVEEGANLLRVGSALFAPDA